MAREKAGIVDSGIVIGRNCPNSSLIGYSKISEQTHKDIRYF